MTAEFSIGQHVGDYEILSILGMGGMGKVYKVRNIISDRVEAMKVLLPDLSSQQSLADRFVREIRLLASLNHPNIAALRTALSYENQLVMIMEFVEGETLSNRLARAPISTAEAVNYSDQVLSALSYAHKQNVIHRDIKPANMMLTPQGVVKLMDFGIARSSKDGSLTSTGTTIGSLNYMPPEQVRGEAADARSDIYSFGVSLYEMLTGKLPFQGDSQYSLMTAHLNSNPPAPITLRADLPPALNEIVLMAMAKDRENRFQSADAFRAALKSVPVSAAPVATATATAVTAATPKSMSGTTLVEPAFPARAAKPPAAPAPHTPAPTPPPPTIVHTVVQPPPPAAAAPATAPTSGSQSAPSTSPRRGLWLALGSLIGAGALIAGGVYIPRRIRTHADPDKAMFPSKTSTDATSGPAAGANPNAPPETSSTTNAPVSINTDKGSVAVDDKGNVSVVTPAGTIKASGQTGSVSINKAGNPKPWRASSPSSPGAGTAGSSSQTVPAPPPGPSPEELAKLEDQADKLSIRAAAASQSLDTLRQQQANSGYGLRGDIAASQERMKLYLSKADAALKAKDSANAQKYFDLADAELSKIEKFLGH